MLRYVTVYVVFLILVGALRATAQVEKMTVLKRKGEEPELVDSASFKRTSREYRIVRGKAIILVPRGEVEYCRPPKPDGFDEFETIAELEAVIRKYYCLWWDTEAFKKLMPAYLASGANAKAIRLYRDMKPTMGSSIPISTVRDYWVALNKDGQSATLRKDLANTIANGTREASAWAYLMRGDLLHSEGKRTEALLEGYLRTVMLFDDIASCRQDALEKAVAAMEEQGDSRADRFRQVLRDELSE